MELLFLFLISFFSWALPLFLLPPGVPSFLILNISSPSCYQLAILSLHMPKEKNEEKE